ncbi:unnamed protein product [Fusarium fujikuroi]|nr:unnamed protein product [Fusarium fujikuroi]
MTDSDSKGSGDETGNGFEDDLAILRDYCLIMMSDDASTFEMHGLVQLAMRRWLKAQGLQDKFIEKYITVMASSFPTGDFENWTRCRALFAHVEAAANYRPSGDNVKKTWSGLLHNGGWYAWLQGSYTVADEMVSQGSRTRKKLLGDDYKATLASMSLLALIYSDQGRWADAEKLYI